ncbi:hypothetical protein OUY22_26270 [Nonomuraea sp. MCN248]|uniref:Uncharacterized protein n=1 Tax=Nonomuraea corallina TaxID=2989783 RepID=A0ABT4SI92_9ACTN|nr:hypothetical protein [Nonomuraea corallina]MDA0636928.1 hypothetical protein [Nonomuraea corallina]
MGGARPDQPLLGLLHLPGGDGAAHAHLEDDLMGQGVDHPRLSLGQLEDPVHGVLGELLAGRLGVLAIQLADLVGGEVTQTQRLGDDVERAGRVRPAGLAARGDLVVTHVTQPAQHHGRGERTALRPCVVAFTELAEDADHAVALYRVDLVEKQHHPARTAAAPLGQRRTEQGARRGMRPGHRRQQFLRPSGPLGGLAEGLQQDFFRRGVVVAGRLGALAGEHQGGDVALGVQLGRQGFQRGRLAGLAGRVQHEVAIHVDQRSRLGKPRSGWEYVVELGITGARGIEGSHLEWEHSHILSSPSLC